MSPPAGHERNHTLSLRLDGHMYKHLQNSFSAAAIATQGLIKNKKKSIKNVFRDPFRLVIISRRASPAQDEENDTDLN